MSDKNKSKRPWGSFYTLEKGKNYRIKKLTVKPDKRLSLQKHFKRSEHWIIVNGSAKITKGNKELNRNKGDHIFINIEEKHRIENIGKEVLEIIEIQQGQYLEEDDIERIEDDYGRI